MSPWRPSAIVLEFGVDSEGDGEKLKDPRTRALLIHLGAYAVGVAICAGINLWLSPDRLRFVWVAAGWGIGVAAHGLAYWLRHARRRERIFTDRRARGFTVHLFAYVAVILLLFVANATVTPNTWWFYWVALGWGAGIALHAWLAFGRDHDAAKGEGAKHATKPQPASKGKAPHKRKAH
jgi:2TM domain